MVKNGDKADKLMAWKGINFGSDIFRRFLWCVNGESKLT